MENKRLKKQQDGHKLETEQLKQDMAISQKTASEVSKQLESANQASQKSQNEAVQSAAHARSLETQLEQVKRELEDNLARYPVLEEEIQVLHN